MPKLFLALFLIAFSTTAHAQQWADVPAEGELRIALDTLVETGVLDASDAFRPDDHLLRAELAVLLARATLKPAYVEHFRGGTSFQDIAPDDWFAPSVEALKQSGAWNTGEQSHLFSPYRAATRAEFLHALFTMKRENFTPFMENGPLALDAQDESAWYYPALSAGIAYAMIVPDEDGRLRPLEPITRREAVLWLHAHRSGTRPAAPVFSSWTLRVLFANARAMLGSLFVLPQDL